MFIDLARRGLLIAYDRFVGGCFDRFSVYILYVRVCEADGGGDCCVPIVYLERR